METQLERRHISVKDFMSKHVQTISPQSTMEEAVQKMTRHNVGSLVVTDELEFKGLLSERDLVSKLVATGRSPERTLVTEVMSGEIVRFTPDESLREAAEVMNSKRNRLLVFENNQLHGIITATDVVKAIYEMHYAFDINRATMKTVYTLRNETSIRAAVRMMNQLRIGSVITTEDTEPDGIFTEWDLVRNVLAPHLSLDETIGDQASRPILTADDGIGGWKAAEIMTMNHIKRLPLTTDGVISGIVTARDLVESFANSSTIVMGH